MSEMINRSAAKSSPGLLQNVNLHGGDKAEQFNTMVFNLDWRLHAIESALWALDQLYVDHDSELLSGDINTFDRLARLIEQAKEMTTRLRSDLDDAVSSIKQSGNPSPESDGPTRAHSRPSRRPGNAG